MKRLHNLDPAEVSLVPRGANKKKFLILKSEEIMAGEAAEQLLKDIKAVKISPDVEEVIKSADSDETRAALAAVVRVLTPFKKSLTPEFLHEVLETAGFKSEEEPVVKKDGEPSDEEMEEAKKAANNAYCEQMKKLGYEKYPAMQMAQKAETEEEEMDETVEKSLAKVPKETRAAVEAIFKQNDDLKKQNELLQKNQEDLTKRVEAVTKAAKRQEFVAKANSYDKLGVPVAELADSLMSLHEVAPKTYEAVTKMLDAANEQVAKGDLFTELGSSLPGNTGGDSWSKIEAAAEAYVAKSGVAVSKAEAVDKFMQTREGKTMYAQYEKQHRRAQKEAQ